MGDQGRRLLTNLLNYGGRVVMSTLTAPGADRLPWDKDWCASRGPHRCSGQIGCRVDPVAAREFNEAAIQSWGQLWNKLRTYVYRRHGAGALNLLGYNVEPQKRGVAHFHFVIGAESARELAALHTLAERFGPAAAAHGWGSVDTSPVHGQRATSGEAAVYIAKYMTAAGKENRMREFVKSGQCPTRAV